MRAGQSGRLLGSDCALERADHVGVTFRLNWELNGRWAGWLVRREKMGHGMGHEAPRGPADLRQSRTHRNRLAESGC